MEREIDARTSDAVALAVRYNCPIYTYEFILSSAGIILDDDLAIDSPQDTISEVDHIQESAVTDTHKSMEDLNSELQDAIDNEDYERASRLRDEINSRSKNN
jgi:bifunctional DNase/RNase